MYSVPIRPISTGRNLSETWVRCQVSDISGQKQVSGVIDLSQHAKIEAASCLTILGRIRLYHELYTAVVTLRDCFMI